MMLLLVAQHSSLNKFFSYFFKLCGVAIGVKVELNAGLFRVSPKFILNIMLNLYARSDPFNMDVRELPTLS